MFTVMLVPGEKVELLASDIFPELPAVMIVLALTPVPETEVVVSNWKYVVLIVSLFISEDPRMINVELLPVILPLLVTVLFALIAYPPAAAERVAPELTVMVPL